MASKLFARIRLRRGLSSDPNAPSNFPVTGVPLMGAELGWENDRQRLWIGNGSTADGAPVIGNTEICTVKPVLTTDLLAAQLSPSAAILHTAANFAVLAGAAVTNTGSSVITGDVGATSAITPGPWTVTGTVHTVNDAATIQALIDGHAAYNTLSVLPSTVLTGDLGGQTLVSDGVTNGIYSYSSSAGLTGTLTLDFHNLSNQKIVIITGSTLTTASASVVHVINSNPTNQVYWVIGSSATLGTTTTFVGNIIAQVSITVTTGATITNGNALALTGSVTLDTNTVNIPTSAVPTAFSPSITFPSAVGTTTFIKYTLLQSDAIGTTGFVSTASIPAVTGILGIDGNPASASKIIEDITYTAVTPGVDGNNITIAYTTGGIAGSEVVTVVGDAISVQIQSGVSTAADIVTAITNSTGPSELLTAANFAVLAGTSVTNTGLSVVHGDVGAVSSIVPGAWTVTGTVHTVNDAPTIQALVDATAAYNTLSVLSATTLTGDLGGKHLFPGVYKYSSSAGLTGTLTLDFANLSNQKIIIITGSTLTTASASSVNIINSNSSNQVFWVIGSSATLGSTTSFAGTILAQTSISFITGANITNGSAIALTGSVTMQDDNIHIPSAIPAASALVTAVANTPGAFETAPVSATHLFGGSGINITALETLAQIAASINAANILNIVAAVVYTGGAYHLQLTDTTGTVIQISASSTSALLTALGLTSGAQPITAQIGTLTLIQTSDTAVTLLETSSPPIGVTFSAAVSGGYVQLYYTSTGPASVMRYKSEQWPM